MRRAGVLLHSLMENHGLTILFAVSFVLVYQIQRIVFTLYPDSVFVWLFTATSLHEPSPGWLLSSLSHGSPQHLAVNAGLLLLTGGISEPHFRKSEYIAFFFGVGGIASLAHISFWPSDAPILGASGAVLAFAGYSMYHYAQQHPDRLLPREKPSSGILSTIIDEMKTGYVLLGFVAILSMLILAFFGWVETGEAADGSHLLGFLLGILYVYLQPAVVGRNCS